MADLSAKLHDHIFEGDDHITSIEAMMQAASALADHITDAMHAALKAQNGKVTPCAGDGLNAELRSWYRQLHELGVVGSGEARP